MPEEPIGSSQEEIALPYPAHAESFETYYLLGEQRTLKAAALVRFNQLYPDIARNSPLFKSKFESFYTKFKRWAKVEKWREWVRIKDQQERQRLLEASRRQIIQNQQILQSYRALIQQGLLLFSRKVTDAVRILQTIQQLERRLLETQDQNLRSQISAQLAPLYEQLEATGVGMKSFKEAKECIELDLYLSKVIDQLPRSVEVERQRLDEQEFEQVDRIMEAVMRVARRRFAEKVEEIAPGEDVETEESDDGEEEVTL